MSDVFNLPVIKGHLVGRDCVAVLDGNGTFSAINDSAAPFVIEAINNYDRLVEENAELKSDLEFMCEMSKFDAFSRGQYRKIEEIRSKHSK